MCNESPIPPSLLSDHLVLLVGANPLPGWVAANLLVRPDPTLWLLHSKGGPDEPDTKGAAENLEQALLRKNPGWRIRLEPIPTDDNLGIEKRVKEMLAADGGLQGSIGLNYTGGTKPMAIHTYRALERAANREPVVFSYLDPRTLSLRFDGVGTRGSTAYPILQNSALRAAVEIDLDALARLHGYKREPRPPDWASAADSPDLPVLCAALSQVHANQRSFDQWRQWMEQEKFTDLPDPARYPLLKGVVAALDQLCGGPGQATPDRVAAALRPHVSNPTFASCAKWFIGGWLEEYAAACFRAVRAPVVFSDQNLVYGDAHGWADAFELDAAAVVGYQLFALSAIVTSNKEKAKEHLLELYVRGRQLGGDEARVALVCCSDDPVAVKREVSRAWDAVGKVEVFGCKHLVGLKGALEDWFRRASAFV